MFKIILLISFFLPFQVALNPAAGVDLASIRVVIIVLFLTWLAGTLKRKKIFLGSGIQPILVLSFLFLSCFSLFFALNADWGLRKLAFLFSIFSIYFIFADIASSEKKIIKIARSLIWGGFLVSLVGIAQFFLQFIFGIEKIYKFWSDYVVVPFLGKTFSEAVLRNPSWLVNISGHTYLRATSVFPDPHMLAFFLNILIFLCLGLIFFSKKKRATHIIFLFFLILASLLTFSRGGYLGLAGGFIFLAIYFIPKINRKYKIAGAAIIIFLGLFLIVPGPASTRGDASSTRGGPVSQRFFSSFNLSEGSNAGRIKTWNQAIEVIARHPVFGVGIGNYPLEIKAVADYREPIYAHNAYLDIAAETGIITALIWMALLFLAFRNFILKSKGNIFFLGAAAALVSFAAHSLVETPIYSPVVLTLFLILISFASANIKDNKEHEEVC
jgi:O-antigen ligase